MKSHFIKPLIIIVAYFYAQSSAFSSDTTSTNIDNRIQFFFEELINKKKNTNEEELKPVEKKEIAIKKIDPNLSKEELYQLRIAELDKTTPIKLEYNDQVKRFIEIYSVRRKKEFGTIIGRSEIYFPIFEEGFDKYNLPLELKHLSVVESSLNPIAVSPSGAVGLWQFLYNTSKMFDLEITSYIDERRDPYKSTEAACRYFAYLYNIFNDWQLAIASFNGGPGEIRNAIEKSGGKTNFWELQPYLAKQTKDYVPAFIACVYVMTYGSEHGIETIHPEYDFLHLDTVKIKKQADLSIIATELEIDLKTLKSLNPLYKTNTIPETDSYLTLIIPSDKSLRFIRKESKIYGTQIEEKNYLTQIEASGDTTGKTKIIHKVKKGEFFHKIALNYRCNIEDIKRWNNLKNNNLHPAQVLIIWVPENEKHLYTSKEEVPKVKNAQYIVYTVQQGDTIWSIAEKFNLKSIEELLVINNDLDQNNIKPGQKIKINW